MPLRDQPMIKIEKHIPNFLTLCNLFCGMYGIIACFSGGDIDFYGYELITKGSLKTAGLMVFAGAFFDLLDGMAARLFRHSSELGKQLDSLADMVTFGVLPSTIIYVMLLHSHKDAVFSLYLGNSPAIALLAFAIGIGAALRLARFNIDTRQLSNFIGLPSPANGLFFASLPLIAEFNTFFFEYDAVAFGEIVLNPYLLIGLSLLFAWLMNSNIRMFSFKLQPGGFARNKLAVGFAATSAVLFVLLYWLSVPLIILLYIIVSLFTQKKSTDEIQS